MNCEHSEQTSAYLDGELTGEALRAAEAHLAQCPDCQALAEDAARLSDALRVLDRYPAPAALRGKIIAALEGERRRSSKPFWLGAASGAGAALLAASLAFLAILPPSAENLAQSLTASHAAALNGDLIQVASSDHHTVKPWLAAHAGLSPPAEDFAAQGFPLAGGRAEKFAGEEAAVAVYRRGNHIVDLYAWPDRGRTLPPPGLVHGFRVRFWKSGDMDFAAISDVDSASFDQFTALASRK